MMKSSLTAACLTLALLTTAACEKGGEKEAPSTTTTPPSTTTTTPSTTTTPPPAAETPSAAAAPDAATAETATMDAGATTAAADAGAMAARDAGTAGKTTSKGPASIPAPNIKISKAKADIAKGQELFASKGCVTCHRMGGRLVGPDLTGVMQRRPQEWVERMILRPDVMVKEDEVARQLLAQYLTPMPNQAVDPDKELPLLLAYLNSVK